MTDTDRTDVGELVRRLQSRTVTVNHPPWQKDCREAADALTALEAENKRLREELACANTGALPLLYRIREALGWNDKTSLDILDTGVRDLRKRAETAESEVARLKQHGLEALRKAHAHEKEAVREAEERLFSRLKEPDEALVEAICAEFRRVEHRTWREAGTKALRALAAALSAPRKDPKSET